MLDLWDVSREMWRLVAILITKIIIDSQFTRFAPQPFLRTVIIHLFLGSAGILTSPHFLINILFVKFRNSRHCNHIFDAIIVYFERVKMELLVFGLTFDAKVLRLLYLLLAFHHDSKELGANLFLSVFNQLLFLIVL